MVKIKAGGRNAEEIEGLRVVLGNGAGKGSGDGKGKGEKGKGKGDRGESVKLGDVASVVARGRNVGVLVGEKDVRLHLPHHHHQSRPLFSNTFSTKKT